MIQLRRAVVSSGQSLLSRMTTNGFALSGARIANHGAKRRIIATRATRERVLDERPREPSTTGPRRSPQSANVARVSEELRGSAPTPLRVVSYQLSSIRAEHLDLGRRCRRAGVRFDQSAGRSGADSIRQRRELQPVSIPETAERRRDAGHRIRKTREVKLLTGREARGTDPEIKSQNSTLFDRALTDHLTLSRAV